MTDLIPKPKWALLDGSFEEKLEVEDEELDQLIAEVQRLRGEGVNTADYCVRMVTVNAEQVGPTTVRLTRGNPAQCRLFTIDAVERYLEERQAS